MITDQINVFYSRLTGTVNIREEKNVVCLDLNKINGIVSHDVLVSRLEKHYHKMMQNWLKAKVVINGLLSNWRMY